MKTEDKTTSASRYEAKMVTTWIRTYLFFNYNEEKYGWSPRRSSIFTIFFKNNQFLWQNRTALFLPLRLHQRLF